MSDLHGCDLAPAAAIGALDAGERREFEAHAATCPACPTVLREYQELAAVLAVAAPAVPVPPGLRARVLWSVRAQAPGAAGPRRWWPALAMAAAVAGVAVAGVQTLRLQRSVRERHALADELAGRAARVATLEEQRNAILDGHTQMYWMRPVTPGDGPAPGAQVFWRRDQQTWLVHAFALPVLPADRVYQLWFITPDARISAGVFATDPEGHGIAVVPVPAQARGATVAALSVEPRGGSSQPTGPIVLAGSVTGSD